MEMKVLQERVVTKRSNTLTGFCKKNPNDSVGTDSLDSGYLRTEGNTKLCGVSPPGGCSPVELLAKAC